jgi:hypothetical protein
MEEYSRKGERSVRSRTCTERKRVILLLRVPKTASPEKQYVVLVGMNTAVLAEAAAKIQFSVFAQELHSVVRLVPIIAPSLGREKP